MKAARVVGPRQFEILDIETPSPQEGEVLVRMEYASICGSDLINYNKVLPEEDYPLRVGLPCHETSGIVEREQRIEGSAKFRRTSVLQLCLGRAIDSA